MSGRPRESVGCYSWVPQEESYDLSKRPYLNLVQAYVPRLIKNESDDMRDLVGFEWTYLTIQSICLRPRHRPEFKFRCGVAKTHPYLAH